MKKIILPHHHKEDTLNIIKNIPSQLGFDTVADTFDLASDPSRLKILWFLCHTEECVANIAAVVEMSSPAVSHHLKILKNAGLLSYRKEGKEAYYGLAKTKKAQVVHSVISLLFDNKTVL